MALSSHSCFIHFSAPSLVNLGQQASFRKAQGIASTFRTHCSTPVSETTVFASFEGLKHKFRSRMHVSGGLQYLILMFLLGNVMDYIQSKTNTWGSVK